MHQRKRPRRRGIAPLLRGVATPPDAKKRRENGSLATGYTSKSARKREQLALQALGEKLVELPMNELEAIGLDAALFDAVVEAKSMRAHGALRRQRQLIGKLMRSADAEHVESVLVSLGSRGRAAVEVFHAAEAWRDRIVDEGAPALAEFERLASAEQPQVAALLREYEKANETGRRAVRRRLFREVHRQLERMEKCATEATRQ